MYQVGHLQEFPYQLTSCFLEDICVFLETESEILNTISVGRKSKINFQENNLRSTESEGSKFCNRWIYTVKTWQVLQEKRRRL